ncbi:MAG: MFS transporter [Oscillospiraceae bacterium]|nr:MFS transporter [Oscillospiraceae bacterium]
MRKTNFRFELFDEAGLGAQTIKSLKLVIFAVAFGTISFNINGGVSLTGYLKELKTDDFTFGLLCAIGPLAAPVQLLASYILERTQKRKLLFLVCGIIQRMSWLPFGCVPFFVPMTEPSLRIWMASLFLLVSAMLVPFVNVTFFSLAADLVPMNIRGSYFAVRSRIATMFGVAGGILTAWFLDMFSGFSSYAFVFALSAVMGTLDVLCFFLVKFPPMANAKPKRGESFSEMASGVLKNKKYMKFAAFMTLWLFSCGLSSPFYLVHLKNNLLFSNTLVTVLAQILPSVCSILIVKRWGRAIDAHGNKTVMQLTNGILCAAPFLWIFTADKASAAVLVVFIMLLQGCLFSGFEIGANNIMLGQAPKLNRSMYIAVYFMMTQSLGTGLGNAAGGWLLDNVFSIFERMDIAILGVKMTRYNYLFAATALLRLAVVYLALPRLVREEGNTPVGELLRGIFARKKK